MIDIIEAGGLIVRVSFWPGEFVPYSEPVWSDRKVVVRGRTADLKELTKSNSNVNWRAIRWNDAVDGGTVQWQFSSHPVKHSEEFAIEFVNSLSVYRGD